MFRKIVSNLPFSPASIGQLKSYAKKLKKEETKRKIGLIFILLATISQGLIILNPPKESSTTINQPTETYAANKLSNNITRSEEVRNLSKESVNLPSSSPVQAEDRLQYTLKTTNNSNKDVTITIQNNLEDVLEYSSITDKGGGKYDASSQTIYWDNITIKPAQTDSRQVLVSILNKIPTTPTPSNNPLSYDCEITNTYGNTTNLKINCPAIKTIGNIVQNIPNLDDTTNILFATALLLLSYYFYIRSRQLHKELNIIRRHFR